MAALVSKKCVLESIENRAAGVPRSQCLLMPLCAWELRDAVRNKRRALHANITQKPPGPFKMQILYFLHGVKKKKKK